MKLDGFGIMVGDMKKMVQFYHDVLGFEIEWSEGMNNVFLEKDGTLFLMYGRSDFEKMTSRKYEYVKGLNGHYEIAMSVKNYAEVDKVFDRLKWALSLCFLRRPRNGGREPVILPIPRAILLKSVHLMRNSKYEQV